jgi:putative transposase
MAESGELRAYPQRLHHEIPSWVRVGSVFHVRLRVAGNNVRPLTQPDIAPVLLGFVRHYHDHGRWHCLLFLLMPDHAHAFLAFPREGHMSRVVGAWKHYATHTLGIRWQANYFDHRIRHASGLEEKHAYILRNPVVKGLCLREVDGAWVWSPPTSGENPRGARVPPADS